MSRRLGAVALASSLLVVGLVAALWVNATMTRTDASPSAAAAAASGSIPASTPAGAAGPGIVALPSPDVSGDVSLEEVLAGRRSIRTFTDDVLDQAQIGQLLWAAQGVTSADGRRTTPSAGALYPLEVYAVTPTGTSRYIPASHSLAPLRSGDLRPALQAAALGQEAVGRAPLVVVITGVTARTQPKYGAARAPRYVQLEAGHAAQNLLLQAVALGLGAVPIGAFDDELVRSVLALPQDEQPLYLVPVGRPAE